MTVNAIIESGNDGWYSIFMDDDSLSFGLMGEGTSVDEAIQDFLIAHDEMKTHYEEVGKPFPYLEFNFIDTTTNSFSYKEEGILQAV